MTKTVSIAVTVVLAREEIDSPWQDHIWRPAEIILNAPEGIHGKRMARGEANGKTWTRYFAEAPPLELHRKETSAYQFNLSGREPSIYIVLRDSEEDDAQLPMEVHLVTASPYEAQDYLDSSEEIVEPVAMPENLKGLIQDYINEHHSEEKFKKRKRDEVDIEDHKFGQEPIFATRGRSGGEHGKR